MIMATYGILHDFRQPWPHSMPGDRFYAECLDEVALADQLGFDTVWMSEHHLTDDGLLPSPLIILGLGQGYARAEFAAFGVDRSRRGSLLEEGIGILRRAWTSDGSFSFTGAHWAFDQVRVTPRPQRPLPILVGAVSEVALQRAERVADGILVYCGQISDLRARFGLIKKLEIELPVVATGILHIAPSAEQAWAEAAPGIFYLEGEIAKYGERYPADELQRDDYLVGTPERWPISSPPCRPSSATTTSPTGPASPASLTPAAPRP